MKHLWRRFFVALLVAVIVVSSFTNWTVASAEAGTTELHHLKLLVPTNNNPYINFTERDSYSFWTCFTEALAKHGLELELEVVPRDQFEVVSQTRMAAAQDLPDLIVLSYLDQETCVKLAKQGMLLPINEIVKEGDGTAKDFLNEIAAFSRKLNTLDDGNQYWFSSILITTWGEDVCQSPVVPNIRKDWLDALGLKTPETLDEFYDALVAFQKNDMNGNGLADEVVMVNPNFIGNPIAGWFGLGTDLVSVLFDQNKVVCPWYQEEQMKAFITYMKKLVDAGVIDLSVDSTMTTQYLVENKTACTVTYGTQSYLEPQVNVGSASAAEFLPIGPITALEGITAYATGDNAQYSYHRFGFTKACKDTEGAAKLLDFLYSEEYTNFFEFGVEGETYEMVDGKPQFLEGVGQPYWEEMSKKGLTNGLWIMMGILPRVYPGQDLKITEKNAAPYKLEYMEKFSKYPYKALTSGYENNYMALPTDEELDLKNSIYPDLKTYSDETFVGLISGKLSLDNWDSYIAELKKLGMDDYLQMMTNRYERYCNQ